MPNADDATILRPLVRCVAAAIFCLFCGAVAGIFVVRADPGTSSQQVGIMSPTPPG